MHRIIYSGHIVVDEGWLSNTVGIASFLLLAGFIFLMHLSSKKVLWPCSSLFSKIKNQINASEDVVAEKMLSHCRWLCVDPLMGYEWNLLNAKIYLIRGNIKKAYEILRDFNEQLLFEKEKDLLTVKKAGVLAQLGNYKGAATLTSGLKNVEGDLALQRAIVDALCQEVRGELVTSSKTLLSALLNTTETATNEFIPKIYNNLGRIRKIEGNITEALLYYEKAANAAVKMGYKHLIHISFQNLILSYALEKKFGDAQKWIEKISCQNR
jgi:tetratricopeptide (TPR) repeat protein